MQRQPWILVLFIIIHYIHMAYATDKLNLKTIEEEFWTAKDADFSIVQNRAFTKKNRLMITAGLGYLVNDPYTNATIRRLGVGYYFSERWGFEIDQTSFAPSFNDATNELLKNNVYPNFNLLKSYESISVVLVPFYAKTSFIDRKILYFDIQIGFGMGRKSYNNYQQSGQYLSQSTFGYHFDITQNLFLSNHIALRIDLKNQWSEQARRSASSAAPLPATRVNDSLLIVGVSYFF